MAVFVSYFGFLSSLCSSKSVTFHLKAAKAKIETCSGKMYNVNSNSQGGQWSHWNQIFSDSCWESYSFFAHSGTIKRRLASDEWCLAELKRNVSDHLDRWKNVCFCSWAVEHASLLMMGFKHFFIQGLREILYSFESYSQTEHFKSTIMLLIKSN